MFKIANYIRSSGYLALHAGIEEVVPVYGVEVYEVVTVSHLLTHAPAHIALHGQQICCPANMHHTC